MTTTCRMHLAMLAAGQMMEALVRRRTSTTTALMIMMLLLIMMKLRVLLGALLSLLPLNVLHGRMLMTTRNQPRTLSSRCA